MRSVPVSLSALAVLCAAVVLQLWYEASRSLLFVYSHAPSLTDGRREQLIGYIIVGIMVLMTNLALAEMAVLFPVNGAFFTYTVRWLDPSWWALSGYHDVLVGCPVVG